MRSWTVALLVAATLAAARSNPGIRRMDVEARHHDLAAEKRAPAPQGGFLGLFPDDGGNNSSTTIASSGGNDEGGSSSTNPGNGGGNTSTSTSTTQAPPPPDNPTSTSTVNDTPSTTSTSTTPTSTSAPTSTTSSTGTSPVIISRTSSATYQGTTLYAGSGNLSNLRASQTATTTSEAPESTGSGSFMQNKSAVAATFTILGIVAAGGLVFVGFWFYRKSKRGAMIEEDTWDEASMKEYPRGGPAITPPSAAVLADEGYGAGGLARKNTVLPSQSAGAGGPLTRSKSNGSPRREIEPEEEPDEILQLPPVTNYERPRDSAYDIVPAAPPPAAYVSQGGGYGYNAYASGSTGKPLHPPKRAGDHTSFGSGIGNDPFAGTGFVDATRESTYGPGQAGRGAGFKDQSGAVGMGNQWPQGYNQTYGYSGGSQSPYGANGYGAGYGYAQ